VMRAFCAAAAFRSAVCSAVSRLRPCIACTPCSTEGPRSAAVVAARRGCADRQEASFLQPTPRRKGAQPCTPAARTCTLRAPPPEPAFFPPLELSSRSMKFLECDNLNRRAAWTQVTRRTHASRSRRGPPRRGSPGAPLRQPARPAS
jgi:hypothetical protein